MIVALTYLIAIMGIEISLLLGINPGWGIFVYGLVLISLLVFAALDTERGPMLIGLSGIPIVRIIGYGTPFSQDTLSVHFGVTGLVFLVYIVSILRMPEFAAFHILRFPRNWLMLISIIPTGVIIGFCQFWAFPQKELYFSGSLEIITFIAALSLSVFTEEVVFRGIALTGLIKSFTPGVSVVFAAFFYTCLFIPFGSVAFSLVMFFTSIFYGFVTVRSSGLYGVMGAHFISSLLYYLIFPTIY